MTHFSHISDEIEDNTVSFCRIANDASIIHEINNKLKFKSIKTSFVQKNKTLTLLLANRLAHPCKQRCC